MVNGESPPVAMVEARQLPPTRDPLEFALREEERANDSRRLLREQNISEALSYPSYPLPLDGFKPLRSPTLIFAAASPGAIARQFAPACLLQQPSPNHMVDAGTSSVEHLHKIMEAAPETIAPPDGIAAGSENTFRPHS